MKKLIYKVLFSFTIVLMITVLVGMPEIESKASDKTSSLTCVTASPSSLEFGLRGEASTQYITASGSGPWEAYVSDSWMSVNGNGSYQGTGTESIAVTTSGSFPVGTTTGYVTIYDFVGISCGSVPIQIRYVNCPSCE